MHSSGVIHDPSPDLLISNVRFGIKEERWMN